MECLISNDIYPEKNSITVEGDEFKHVKALRLAEKDLVLITNGMGQTCLSEFFKMDKHSAEFLVLERYENLYENAYNLGLAMPTLDNRDRFEFALEKAVELGVTEIVPVYSKFTQKFKVKHSRIQSKVTAALKQCKRSRIPVIRDFRKMSDIEEIASEYDTVVILDETGDSLSQDNLNGSVFLILGPEGGFSDEELEFLTSLPSSVKFNLGIRRLRAETAAVNAMSVINYLKRS